MKSQLLDGVKKMEFNIGLDVTVGELIGEKLDSSESKCTETIWPLRTIALGEQLKKHLTTLL